MDRGARVAAPRVLHTALLAHAQAVLPLAFLHPLVPSSQRTPVARHTTCCLARRRLQYRVLMESVLFSSLVLSHSQLREALAATATPGSRSFCGQFPHRPVPLSVGKSSLGQK